MTNQIPVSDSLHVELNEADKGESFEFEGKVYTLIEEGDWIDEGKYDFRDIIFMVDGKYYRHELSRSGSYFTDYEYDYDDYALEVRPVEKTVIEYEVVE